MFFPYCVDVPLHRWPIANWAIIGITILATVVVWLNPIRDLRINPKLAEGASPDQLQALREKANEPLPAPFLSLDRHRLRPWNFLTYPLVHEDGFHLVLCMFFLFLFGNAVNAKLGDLAFLAWYFFIGVIAGCAWLGFDRNEQSLLGSQPAVMGIAGMFLVFYPSNDIWIVGWWRFQLRHFAIAAFLPVLVIIVFAVLLNFVAPPGQNLELVNFLTGAVVGIAGSITMLALGFAKPSDGEENFIQFLGLAPATEKMPARKRKLAPLPVSGIKRRAQPDQEE
jgi:membrane associated rhomboid family serine protease